jgi:hypothetical protein
VYTKNHQVRPAFYISSKDIFFFFSFFASSHNNIIKSGKKQIYEYNIKNFYRFLRVYKVYCLFKRKSLKVIYFFESKQIGGTNHTDWCDLKLNGRSLGQANFFGKIAQEAAKRRVLAVFKFERNC